MWTQKELKIRGKKAFLRNKWAAIAVCFILAFTGAEFANSVYFVHEFDETAQTNTPVIEQRESISNWNYLLKWLDVTPDSGNYPMLLNADDTLGPIFNRLTASFSSFFAFLDRSAFTGFAGITLALLGVIGGTWFKIWVINALYVGARRFFLENRKAERISISAMFYPFAKGNWWNIVKTRLLESIYLALWAFTFIGFFIKIYSYRMIPYILAENPNIKPTDAITLSRKMMNGHKWRLLLLDAVLAIQWTLIPTVISSAVCYFIGTIFGKEQLFSIIAALLVSILSLFFVNGYRSAILAELYSILRAEQKKKNEPLARYFIVSEFNETSKVLSAEKASENPVFHTQQKHKIDYNYTYHIRTLILLFFAFAFIGWVWEVALHIVTQGIFINRGVMLGPWLPIYGTGSIAVLILLKKLFKNPIATFFVSMVICSIVEYFTSWYLEVTKGIRWWDYSGYLFNLNGRICLEGAIIFGLGCCAVVYFAAPLLAKQIDKIKPSSQLILCVILIGLFGADSVYSKVHPNTGKGITDYPTQNETDKKAAFILPSCKVAESFPPAGISHLL